MPSSSGAGGWRCADNRLHMGRASHQVVHAKPLRQFVVGIDLGTTNSAVAYVENGKPKCIPNADGDKITPSVVTFLPGICGAHSFGSQANTAHPRNAGSLVTCIVSP